MFAVIAGLFGIELECVLLLCSLCNKLLMVFTIYSLCALVSWYCLRVLYVACVTRSHDRPSLRSPTTQTAGGEVHSAEPPLFPATAFTPTGEGLATTWAQYNGMSVITEV